MPTKKRTTKRTVQKQPLDEAVKQLHGLGDRLMEQLRKAKDTYQQLDPESRKKVIAGVAGAVAVLAGVRAAKKITRRSGSKKKKDVM